MTLSSKSSANIRSVSHSTLVFPPRSESLQAFLHYGLAQDDLTSADDNVMQDTDANTSALHSGAPVAMNNSKGKQPTVLRLRSPLQAVEDRLLDATETEMELQAQKHSKVKEEESPEEEDFSMHGAPVELSKAKGKQPASEGTSAADKKCHCDNVEAELEKILADINKREAERLAIDKEVAVMKEAHEKFKKEFNAKYRPDQVSEDNDDNNDDDLPSLRSSIDLDEEPTLHVATAMPIYRITPGMVKLINIPPRKKKSTT
jgi:hypothetical protein